MVTLTSYVDAFVDQLIQVGLRDVVFSPGSRSTPLALGFARRNEIRLTAQLDERSAGFLALGIAKGRRTPTALVCTSGTAAANYLPAIVEAKYGRTPLLVLTADRPHEARELGAPQTIDQIKMYGDFVKLFVEMPPADGPEDLLAFVRTTAARAFAVSLSVPAGPVHLNFPFREPLVPKDDAPKREGAYVPPPITTHAPQPRYDAGELRPIAQELERLRRGIIICGPLDDPRFAASVTELGRAIGYPVLADPLSQMRFGPHDREIVVDTYEWMLRSKRFRSLAAPEAILHFGAVPTSKPLVQFMAAHRLIVVDPAEWNDPTLRATDVIRGEPHAVCQALRRAIDPEHTPDQTWLPIWIKTGRRVRAAIEEKLDADEALFEGRVARELVRLLPEGANLFVGSSMPIRDVDAFAGSDPKRLRIVANRGANGIDGVVSTACGVASVSGPTALLIGDVSFFHDLNGLLATKLHRIDLTVVLVHNDGGGIFSFLPQAELADEFERLFGTPHGLDFAAAVRMYGGRFTSVGGWSEFRECVKGALGRSGLDVIEVRTSRLENVDRHRRLWAEIAAEVDRSFSSEKEGGGAHV